MIKFRSALLAAAVLASAPALAQPPEGGRGAWRERGDIAQPGNPGLNRDGRGFGGDNGPRDLRPDTPPPGDRNRFDGRNDRFQGDPGRDGDRRGFDRTPPTVADRDRFTGQRFDGDRRFDGRYDDRRFDDRRNGDRDRFNARRYDRDDRRWGDNRYDGRRYDRPGDGRFNRWNDGWRNDRRYDWQGWRDRNRNLFRGPRYIDPRGYGHGYRPFARGYRLQPFFYGRSYWLNDPWAYHLPPAYGSYRWVRYYDDVLLVDVASGFVADVIRGFFW